MTTRVGFVDLFIAFPLVAAFQAPTQATVEPPSTGIPGPPFTGKALMHFVFMLARAAQGEETPNTEVDRAELLLGDKMSSPQRSAFAAQTSDGAAWSTAMQAAGFSDTAVERQRQLEDQLLAYFRAPPVRNPWAYAFAVQLADGRKVIDFRGANWLTGEYVSTQAVSAFCAALGLSRRAAADAAKSVAGYMGYTKAALDAAAAEHRRIYGADVAPLDPANVHRVLPPVDYGLPPPDGGGYGLPPPSVAGELRMLVDYGLRPPFHRS